MSEFEEEQDEGPAPSLAQIKHIILILSGKGGVGKSSVTTQTALSLCEMGYKVGVLDIDLTGPSLPRMFGLEDKSIYQDSNGWRPVAVETNNEGSLCVISIGFLLGGRGNSVVWKGPKKTAMIKQFVKDVAWGELDYLLIDTPPGTSDEHISIAEQLRFSGPDGAIVVTTPQGVATADVKKELNFCKKIDLKIIGIVENMSGFICPHCAECTNIFSSGGGKALADEFSVPYLGNIPIDPQFVDMIENQKNTEKTLSESYSESSIHSIFHDVIQKVLDQKHPARF
ncbi:similar to Saccharomyces cerevisiae YIL003W CFD1 Highly conserved, iron-sulfur cluster binding protein localized in the cytoplasm [Maudiozyma saulgeensis]|uniref:Similar to Saccharomyces cerevisiae YIL003W CFD1 Highly conserved, iron-sulfur cluster binding protein localized in the cytoplasm n=1 Tax=Maudiozyma saulgeensis TaxID=1789683 RepID=A0A1X7R3H9_9SACH|nr:similar to Saccharomyces cerevisiae YIL003W CFD1 Highly conserved, iron-sulfur cluster binding protein localized in the cytoplasm [Kazachstania saulgeensis]